MGYKEIAAKIYAEGIAKNKHFANPIHKETIEILYPIIVKEFGEPASIDLISAVRTYKITMPDGLKMKVYLYSPVAAELQNRLYAEGLRVPKTIKVVLNEQGPTGWKFDEWIEGECLRKCLLSREFVKSVAPKYWYKQGAILGAISSLRYNGLPINMCDILWSNFIIDYQKDEVSLIDCKKLRFDVFPERWIYYNIFFNQYHLKEQVDAFTEGYLSEISGARDRLDLLLRAKDFSEKVYEKLERVGRV